MSLTTFSGPVESLEGGFVITGPGDYILNGNGSFTTFGEGQFRIDTTAGPDAGGIIINNGRLTASRLNPATGGGNIVAIGGGIRATDTNFNLSAGAGYLTDSNYIGIIVDSTGGIREVSGIPMEGSAATGSDAGIIGTSRAYATSLSRTSTDPSGVSISSLYVDLGNLSIRDGSSADLFVIGRFVVNVGYPAYIMQLLTGPDTQMGELLAITVTCLEPPSLEQLLPFPVGFSGSDSPYSGQGAPLFGNVEEYIAAKPWSAGEQVQIPLNSISNNYYIYLLQGASTTASAELINGLFRLDFHSIDI